MLILRIESHANVYIYDSKTHLEYIFENEVYIVFKV